MESTPPETPTSSVCGSAASAASQGWSGDVDMIPVYRVRAAAQSSRMDEDDDLQRPKAKRRWGSMGYIILIIIAVLIAVCVVLPLGEGIRSIFQRLTDAFQQGK